jgi:thioredoxin-related protein
MLVRPLLITAAMLFLGQQLQAQGINFETSGWQEILAKAKAEKKLVFLDAYASWCGPCKKLSNSTFPDPEVGAFFNQHFVNAKIDMEKGEGVELSEKYKVAAFPTLIFLDSNGVEVHRAMGYLSPEQLIEVGKKAINPATQSGTMKRRYEEGDRDPAFVREYLASLSEMEDPMAFEVASEYLDSQTDYGTEENKLLIAQYAIDPTKAPFQYLIANRASFDEQFGTEEVGARIESILTYHFMNSPELDPAEAEKMVQKALPENAPAKWSQIRMTMYYMQEDMPNFMTAAAQHYDEFSSTDFEELNMIARFFYENSDDKDLLGRALKWAEKSVQMEEQYKNTDTVAHLLSKLGKKKAAKKMAEKAIALAKKSEEDYTSAEELLQELKKS